MTAVTREQFSVPHEHKLITQFINKIIKCKWRKSTKAIIHTDIGLLCCSLWTYKVTDNMLKMDARDF